MTSQWIIQKSFFASKKFISLCLSHLLPLSIKYMRKVFQRRNLATVTVIKLIFLLLQNRSMYTHSSGTNHLVLTDYSPQVSSNGQIQNNPVSHIKRVYFSNYSSNLLTCTKPQRYKYILSSQYLHKTIMETTSAQPGLLHS